MYPFSDINPCYQQSTPCQNNGICVAGANGAYTCTCSSPYTGINCETTICKSNWIDFNEKNLVYI